MNLRLIFSRHARHLWIMVFVIAAAGVGGFYARQALIPPGFGDTGPFRASALTEEMDQPMTFHSDNDCLKCHSDVEEARAESPHQAVRCFHCHGIGREHVIAATLAQEKPDHPIPPAEEWDGDFRTSMDLFVTQDRGTCLSCHQRVVGMPASFRSIVIAEHLEEQGASEPDSKNVCYECHDGHSPGL
ncbi:MAG: hypothetical protein KDA96_13860 [Planctomycetaceae bacterium]|nr:hypothetical protein [Planctomycetaceae bacterium]